MTHPAHRDEYSAPWFDGLLDGRLLIRRCRECSRFSRPDAAACPACASDHLEWAHAAGTATVVTTVTDHTASAPVTLGLVELDEGPWLHARLDSRTAAGDRVHMVVEKPAGGEPIPTFQCSGQPSATTTRLDTPPTRTQTDRTTGQ